MPKYGAASERHLAGVHADLARVMRALRRSPKRLAWHAFAT